MLSNLLFSQGNYVFKLNKENLNRSPKNNEKLEDIFDSNHSYKIAKNKHFEKIKADKYSNLTIETPDGIFKASVKKVAIPSFYTETNDKGIDSVSLDNIMVLNGDLIGKDKGQIRLVLYDDGHFDGGIILKEKSYLFDYYRDEISKNTWINYYRNDEIKGDGGKCGENSISSTITSDAVSNINKPKAKVAATCSVLNMALEADYEFFQQHGSTASSKMISAINMSESHFNPSGFPFNLKLRILNLNVWTTSSDPYTSTLDIAALTNQFRNYWNTNRTYIPRDLAHIFSGRTFNASLNGYAFKNAMCLTTIDQYSLSRYRNNLSDTPFFVSKIVTHEIGHQLGCDHNDGTFCGNSSFSSVMCADIFPNQIIWSTQESNVIDAKLNSTTCMRVPNIRPTVNNVLYTSAVSIPANSSRTLSLNYPSISTGASPTYNWFVSAPFVANGTYTPNGTSATVSITNNYQITGQLTDECGYIANNNFIQNKSTSFASVNVYPNSVNNYLEISTFNIDNLDLHNLKIFDSSGKEAQILTNMERKELNIFRVNIKNRKSGIYYLQIEKDGFLNRIRLNLE